jgi:hypothetical protein
MTATAKKAVKAAPSPKRLTEDDLRKKHPKSIIVEGSLLYVDPKNKVQKLGNRKVPDEIYTKHPNKQVVLIKTVGEDGKEDGDTRWVATSDLHHVRMSEKTAKAVRMAAMKASRAKNKKVKVVKDKAPKKEAPKKEAPKKEASPVAQEPVKPAEAVQPAVNTAEAAPKV